MSLYKEVVSNTQTLYKERTCFTINACKSTSTVTAECIYTVNTSPSIHTMNFRAIVNICKANNATWWFVTDLFYIALSDLVILSIGFYCGNAIYQ